MSKFFQALKGGLRSKTVIVSNAKRFVFIRHGQKDQGFQPRLRCNAHEVRPLRDKGENYLVGRDLGRYALHFYARCKKIVRRSIGPRARVRFSDAQLARHTRCLGDGSGDWWDGVPSL